ncbi:MAG: hypothetical protein ACE5JK_01200, partial [Candidatus Omnitrophota bacterium]
ERWGIDVYIGRVDQDKAYAPAGLRGALGIWGLEIHEGEEVRVIVRGLYNDKTLNKVLDILGIFLRDNKALHEYTEDYVRRPYYYAVNNISKDPFCIATVECAYTIDHEVSQYLNSLFDRSLREHGIKCNLIGVSTSFSETEKGELVKIVLTGGKSRKQLEKIAGLIRKLLTMDQRPWSHFEIFEHLTPENRAIVRNAYPRLKEILGEPAKEDGPKNKTERVKELFGEDVIKDELDLDYEFQQFVEGLRRQQFLDGNTGGAGILKCLPYFIDIVPILKCTARCQHCMHASNPERTEQMSTEDIARVLDATSVFVNNPFVHLAGGEVLLRKDLIDIIRRFPVGSLTTNASTMSTLDKARKFITALKEAFEARKASMPKGFTKPPEEARKLDMHQQAWLHEAASREGETEKNHSGEFEIDISLDDIHMAQPGISAEKIVNLVQAVAECYPEAELAFLGLEGKWESARDELIGEFRDSGYILAYDSTEENFTLTRKSDGWKKKIKFKTNIIHRLGEAIYLPDEQGKEVFFREFDIWEAVEKTYFYASRDRITPIVNYQGDVTVCDMWATGHGPLVFGNAIQESWDDILRRMDKDPLLRALAGMPDEKINLKRILEIAEEYHPGIAESIQKGKPGTIHAFFYWLLSNPERKLYITYRLLNECYEAIKLVGNNPFKGMSNDEIKKLVQEQVGELRSRFRGGEKDISAEPVTPVKEERISAIDFSDTIRIKAAEAKKHGQKIIIGLDDSWIAELGTEQKQAIQGLLNEISRLPEHLKKLGLNNVIIVRGRGNALGQDLLRAASDADTSLANVVVLASEDTLKNKSFNNLKSTPEEDRAFIAEIDSSELLEKQAELRYSGDELFVPYLEMIRAALKLAFGEQVPLENTFMRILPDEESPRVYHFIPKARAVKYEKLKIMYENQRQTIVAA